MLSNTVPVLHIEDDDQIRSMISEELSDYGYYTFEPTHKRGSFSIDIEGMLDGSSPRPAVAIVDLRIVYGKNTFWPPDIAVLTELTRNGIPTVITTAEPDAHSVLKEFGIESFIKPINLRQDGNSFTQALKQAKDDPEATVADLDKKLSILTGLAELQEARRLKAPTRQGWNMHTGLLASGLPAPRL